MKNRQGLTIAALIVAIVGLSIGFAAFSNTLNISSTASVNPDPSNLKVVFANNTDVEHLNTDPVQVFSASTGASGVAGTINNEAQNGPALTGLKASFTAPGQSVVYKLNVVNAGKLKAYLTDIVFGTTGNPAKTVSCTAATKDSNNEDIPAAEQATDSLVQAACEGISISVKIGELDAKTASGSLNNLELNVAGYKEVVITISYASGSAYVDGPMNVAFGDIQINAKSVGTQSQGGTEQPSVNPNPEEQELVIPDYVVTPQGEITAYYGSATEISIPSSLPLYTQSNIETLVVPMCVDMAVASAGYTAEGALTACEDIKTQVESGDTSSPFYSGLKEGGAIVYGYYATGNNVTVTSIGEGSIGEGAFEGKNLTSVTIPNTVETIGDYAFRRNEIETLNLSNATSLTSIGTSAFYRNRLTSVTIPDSVTTIGTAAFDLNRLTTVTIGSGITSIGKEAFYNGVETQGYGPNAVTKVTINAHEQDVYVDGSAFGGFNGTICWLQDDPTCGE